MKKHITFVFTLAFVMLVSQSFATKWRVNSNPSISANFTSLQAAVNSSSVAAGDTLYCENGSYFGDVTLTKRLVIIGPGYFLSQNDSTHAYPSPAVINNLTFDNGSSNTTVTGMKIIAYVRFGIGNYDTIQNITLVRNRIYSIYSGSGNYFSFENIILRQCYIDNQISFNHNFKSIYIQNCIIVGSVSLAPVTGEFSNNTQIANTSSTTVFDADNTQIFNNIMINNYGSYYAVHNNTFDPSSNNTFSKNVVDNTTNTSWPNNYYGATDTDVVSYQGSGDSQYQLKSSSPAIGYGFNGNDCGAFGGSYPYVLSGLPYMIPHIFDATIPGSANKTDGLNVIIKAKVQNQ